MNFTVLNLLQSGVFPNLDIDSRIFCQSCLLFTLEIFETSMIYKNFFFFFLTKLNITNIYFQIRSFRIRENLKGFTKQFFLKLTLKLFLYIYINSIVNNNEFKIKC